MEIMQATIRQLLRLVAEEIMKALFCRRRLFPACLCAGAMVLAAPAPAQAPMGVSLRVSGGSAWLSVTGAVGTVCQVQYATNLAQPNPWLWLTNLTLASNPQSWADASCAAAGARFYRAIWFSTNMALIPAGTFTMGDGMVPSEGHADELPLHRVPVSAFYMDPYLVTWNLWSAVKAWADGNGYGFDHAGSGKAGNHPVQTVNWYDAVKWCNARSQMEGRTPCYYTDAGLTAVYQTGQAAVYVKWSANGYRLPTEAEWERAARGGTTEYRFPWGDAQYITQSRANYYSSWTGSHPSFPYDLNGTSGFVPAFNDGVEPYTSPVGYFPPNCYYGLYDMTGNVYQWCWDWYDSAWYSNAGATQSDTRGPAAGFRRVFRGGGWCWSAFLARTAVRSDYSPADAYNYLGFRCVRGL